MNPVLQYGFEKFCRHASEVGIDGLILPDLPMFEFEKEFAPVIKKYGLDFVFLVTPETKDDRIRKLDQLTSGFLYAVSSSSTTGKNTSIGDQKEYFNKLQVMKLKNPVLIGFGIKDKTGFTEACSYANGAIVGTAFIKVLEKASTANLPALTGEFIKSLK
jgi:tryptophan synthase alpha chain